MPMEHAYVRRQKANLTDAWMVAVGATAGATVVIGGIYVLLTWVWQPVASTLDTLDKETINGAPAWHEACAQFLPVTGADGKPTQKCVRKQWVCVSGSFVHSQLAARSLCEGDPTEFQFSDGSQADSTVPAPPLSLD